MKKEEQIKIFMKSYGISKEEAEQLWEDDQNDYIGEEGEEMQKKADALKRNYVSSKPDRKKSTRERKVDGEKLDILQTIAAALENEYNMSVDIEKELNIHFSLGESNYSLTLTRHRKK